MHWMFVEKLCPPAEFGPGMILSTPIRGWFGILTFVGSGGECFSSSLCRSCRLQSPVPVQYAHVASHHGWQWFHAGSPENRRCEIDVKGKVIIHCAFELWGHARIFYDQRDTNAASFGQESFMNRKYVDGVSCYLSIVITRQSANHEDDSPLLVGIPLVREAYHIILSL